MHAIVEEDLIGVEFYTRRVARARGNKWFFLSSNLPPHSLSKATSILREVCAVTRFYEPDLTANPDSPFVRDASNKLVRRGYWMDMPDRTLVMVMTQGIGANLTNDEKRAHLLI
jgi:hypothetical protein